MDEIAENFGAETKRAKQSRLQHSQQPQQLKRHDKPRTTPAPPTRRRSAPPPKRPLTKRVTADEPTDNATALSADAAADSAFAPFDCQLCTFHNRKGEACEMCCEPRPSQIDLTLASSSFRCAICRKRNSGGTTCISCCAIRPDMVEAEADDEYKEGQPRKSKRQKTTPKLYLPSVRLVVHGNKRPEEGRPQQPAPQHNAAESASEPVAGRGGGGSSLMGVDLTADVRTLFLQTDWQALSDELEWIRRDARGDRERMARDKQVKDEQLAALQKRYTWPASTQSASLLPNRPEEVDRRSGKEEAIEIDMHVDEPNDDTG